MPGRKQTIRVCPTPGCPLLTPCPEHATRGGSHWSPQRDRTAQHRFRARVLARDGHRCRVDGCGATEDLVAHHVIGLADGGDDDVRNGLTLCARHHRELDPRAR